MTTHPPGGPTGPTGPGREERERWIDANADRLPTLAEVVADAERLLQQAARVIARDCDPTPTPLTAYYRLSAAMHIAAARRDMEDLAQAHLPEGVEVGP